MISLVVVVLGWGFRGCSGLGTYGFDFHHRFSDPVKGILGFDGVVPDKGTFDYYKVLVHGDIQIRGRHLASDNGEQTTPLTFFGSNQTYRIASLG